MVGAAGFGLAHTPRPRTSGGAERYSGVRVQQEIEAKFAASADVSLPDLTALRTVARIESPGEVTLEAVYFDTADLRLAKARTTLRRRTGGTDAGWHLKVPVSTHERTEFHAPLGSADDAVPAELVALARARIREAPLVPVAVIRTTRTVHRLCDAAGRVLAEVSDDAVTAQSLGADERVVDQWREWEVELAEGDCGLMTTAVALLTAAGGVTPVWWSKLARALGDRLMTAAANEVHEPFRPDSAGAVLGDRLRSQRDELLARDPLVRRDEPGSVHQMRVATRRLGSAIATFRPLLDRDQSEAVRDGLRWLAGLLGAARDVEVSRLRLAELVAREPAELLADPAVRRLDGDRVEAYRAAYLQVLEALDSTRYFRLLDALDALVDAPRFTAVADEPAAQVVASRARRDGRRLARAFRIARDAPPGPRRDELLHEARKTAKRAGYAAEAAVPVIGRPAEKFARSVRGLQVLLGHHHDTVELRGVLLRVSAQAHLAGEDTFSYGRLHALEQREAERLEDRLPAAWDRVAAGRRRRWLR